MDTEGTEEDGTAADIADTIITGITDTDVAADIITDTDTTDTEVTDIDIADTEEVALL